MNVLVIGANGQIGTKVVHKLKESDHPPRAMVRKEEQVAQFENKGIDVVLADLEEDFSHAFEGMDAVVFTAGSGANTPKSQTKVIDRDAAKEAVDEAAKHNAKRFIMVSALKAGRDPEIWSEPMEHYYEAKSIADNYLKESILDYTILMPGRLSNDIGTGKIELSKHIESIDGRTITRDDVAELIVRILDVEASYKQAYELLQGETPIDEALEALG